MNFIRSFLALAIVIASSHAAANACTCLPPMGPAEEMRRSDAVFLGKVMSIKRNGSDNDPFRSVEVRFDVVRSWKGEERSEQIVFTSSNSAACGYPFAEGKTYLVYANTGEVKSLVTGLCTRTRKLADAREDITELDKVASSGQSVSTGMPKWLADHFAFMTAGSGRWIADNTKFRTENEPFEKYGTEWKWGLGKRSITGRLFALNGGKEAGEFWEYRVFWHPKEKRAVFEQFGATGVFGIGEMRRVELGGGKSELNVEMIFYSPDGSSWHDLHKLTEAPNEHTTRSFNLQNGSWQPRRTYLWRLEQPGI